MLWKPSNKTKKRLSLSILAAVAGTFVGQALSSTNPEQEKIIEQLGWIKGKNVCGGTYQDPLEMFDPNNLPPLTTTPVEGHADQTTLHQTGQSVLIGKVSLKQPGRVVHADTAYLNRDPTTKEITDVDLKGNVSLREPGKLVVAETGHMELTTRVAKLMHSVYRLFLGQEVANAKGLNAWGKAEEVDQKKPGFIVLKDATYTTCSPSTNTWHLTAKRIDLDHASGRGYAHNTWVDVGKVPIFYTPYFNFPIDKRRQSGFLFPSIGNSSLSGFSVGIPYYWNIAPNYDATITPHYYSKRGVQMDTSFRYLTVDSLGQVYGSFLPNDPAMRDFQDTNLQKFATTASPAMLRRLDNQSDNRGLFAWQNDTRFDPHWTSDLHFIYASDDYYFQDFGNLSNFGMQTPNQLLRKGDINYSGENWDFSTKLISYQTLHPINQATVSNPYNSLPEIDWNGNYPDNWGGLDWQFDNQLVYFQRLNNPGETDTPPTSGRLNLQPSVSWPITAVSGYFTPRLQLEATHYNIGYQVDGYDSEIQRTLPIFDIDTGLYFDRDIKLGEGDYQQTLEPRLFYLYVPYRNQNDIPLFDTALVPFNYDALFLTNRYSGLDRIGDANQFTMALTSRFLNQDTGAEIIRGSIGQIYYFRDREVSLCQPGSTPSTTALGAGCSGTGLVTSTTVREKTSPIAGQLRYNMSAVWNTSFDASYDPHQNQLVNSAMNFQYRPAVKKIFNLTYNYLRFGDTLSNVPAMSHHNDLNQAGFSFTWPFRDRWQTVGGWMYNLSHNYPQTYFYGLEYDSCCWATRLVAGRTFSALNQNNNPVFNNAIYLQWQFKGLATVGNQDPATLLMGNISGYQDNFVGFSPL